MDTRRVAGTFSPASLAPAASGRPDHYKGLDLLRGIAAVAVMLYHVSGRMHLPLIFSHGYLAVDFFFVLSGFVMAAAYGQRLSEGSMGVKRFYAVRAIRLMPLVLLGTIASFVVELGRPGIVDQGLHLKETIAALVLGSVLLPTPFVSTLQDTLFPLDGPVWSLFFEAIANLAMPVWARARARRKLVVATIVICGAVLGWATVREGTVHVGFQSSDAAFGLARVGFSFTVGVALFSVRRHAPNVPFVVPPLVLAALLTVPSLGAWDVAFQATCVFVLLPALSFLTVGSRCGARGRRLSALSGDLSYPLYALHSPIVRLVTVVAARHEMSWGLRLAIALGATAVCVAVAAAAFTLYDVPVRRRLMDWLAGPSIA
ncbi:MAG: acyltransferase family protein [Janthinobacterium lividum]